jgi:hypothetical protein
MSSVREEGVTHSVDGVDSFAAFVLLATHPVTVQVGEQPVNVVGTGRVAVPFAGIIV